MTNRVLAGPPLESGAEPYAQHLARLGPLPGTAGLLEALDATGLRATRRVFDPEQKGFRDAETFALQFQTGFTG